MKPSISFLQFAMLLPVIRPGAAEPGAPNPAAACLVFEAHLCAGGWTPEQARHDARRLGLQPAHDLAQRKRAAERKFRAEGHSLRDAKRLVAEAFRRGVAP